ncbi:MAG: NAD(P)/FAD-dependent oxidoreductase, partial [Gammaproteobacteria bacterium]
RTKTITLAPTLLTPTIDGLAHQVQPERTLQYDYLVLAVGSKTNDFGTPGAATYCTFLDSRKQADHFHHQLLDTYLRLSNDAQAGKQVVLKIGIVGAGATGVELAAELHNTTALLRAYGLKLGSDNLQVSIIEAGPKILPALPERISTSVVKELSKLKITLHINTTVSRVTPDGFETADGRLIEADTKVWAAGVKAPEFLSKINGLTTTRTHQVEVSPTLQSVADEHIFAIGDCASCLQANGSRVPPRAQAAHQMANHAYKNLLNLLNNRPLKAYVYHDYGSLVSLSRYSTIGNLMGNLTGKSLMIEGRVARVAYISLYRLHQIALHGYLRTLLIIFSARINRIIRPRLKLH